MSDAGSGTVGASANAPDIRGCDKRSKPSGASIVTLASVSPSAVVIVKKLFPLPSIYINDAMNTPPPGSFDRTVMVASPLPFTGLKIKSAKVLPPRTECVKPMPTHSCKAGQCSRNARGLSRNSRGSVSNRSHGTLHGLKDRIEILIKTTHLDNGFGVMTQFTRRRCVGAGIHKRPALKLRRLP